MCMHDVYKTETKRKGEASMIVKTLESIERKVKENASNNKEIINNFRRTLEKRGLKKGRVRPRNAVEERILDSFTCK